MNSSILLPASSNVAILDRIYQHIVSQPIDDNVSLLGGQMGFALFEAYAQSIHKQSDDSRIWERITTSLAAIQTGELNHAFAGGISGVAWGFLHLMNHGLLPADDLDAQDIVADLDGPLFEMSMASLQSGDFDYLHGGLSAGLYYLERQPSPIIARYVAEMVDTLSATAIRFPNGDITWPFHDTFNRNPEGGTLYNPSLSHGTASIVSILSLFYERGYARQQCAELIHGTLQWMESIRNQSGISVFPTMVLENRQEKNSRLAWCYGDMGIANAFWLCGQKLKNAHWQSIALETMLKTAQRRELAETAVKDAGICHGAAGAAHIFRRFAQKTHHPLFTEAADYWLQQTAQYTLPETDENVFLAFDQGALVPNLGILDGESSVGLVLLADLGVPTYWERFLLLS
ncbi:lanthionine synthetase [Spirosoma sp. BT702]|uniref:Lanthionine synthetase n=1 Tax=Spirosoma profusum TaxID=2771354 RepID=A0A927AQ32_9BACT|nr:lanthionine synthetase LanC family protein [Spirosoma profusum]MBD2699536.1 lanthionine synthetase [Spirosoma profusum]